METTRGIQLWETFTRLSWSLQFTFWPRKSIKELKEKLSLKLNLLRGKVSLYLKKGIDIYLEASV